MDIYCRPIIKSDEIERIVDLHGLIWFTDDRDAIPSHVLLALQHVGAVLLGAFADETPVGFSLAFPGKRNGQRLLWSHATGVLPAYQGRGIGKKLKLLQREIAIEEGYDCIGWTFDPLQAGNANFNIRQLGSVCNKYHIDFYGEVHDGLNNGLPTDRFETEWWLKDTRQRPVIRDTSGFFAVWRKSDGAPSTFQKPSTGQDIALVEIPHDINSIREQSLGSALSWRHATRNAFENLFALGFSVVDFVQTKPQDNKRTRHSYYVLLRDQDV